MHFSSVVCICAPGEIGVWGPASQSPEATDDLLCTDCCPWSVRWASVHLVVPYLTCSSCKDLKEIEDGRGHVVGLLHKQDLSRAARAATSSIISWIVYPSFGVEDTRAHYIVIGTVFSSIRLGLWRFITSRHCSGQRQATETLR